jgi:hypothetical protein
MYRSHAGDMSPVRLVGYHQQKLGLNLLLCWLPRKRNWVQTYELVSRCAGDCVGSPFSREQCDPSKSVDNSRKVAMR